MFITGRRKRQKVVVRRVRTLPKIFECKNCGHKTIKTQIQKDKNEAIVICGFCGLKQVVPANELTEPVDAYGDFIDIYFAQEEYERLTKRAKKLEQKGQYRELAYVYSYLADICQSNYMEANREYEKNKSEEDLENARKWKRQEEEYRKLSKDLFEKIELKELEEGVSEEDSIYEDADEQEFQFEDNRAPKSKKVKRGRTLDEILEDKGFLEF
ncbi:MAG: hypothetical protein ACTSRZ_09245 [Promethearchaeota archaeon]